MKNKNYEVQANGKIEYFSGLEPLRNYLKTLSGDFKVIDLSTKLNITDLFVAKVEEAPTPKIEVVKEVITPKKRRFAKDW